VTFSVTAAGGFEVLLTPQCAAVTLISGQQSGTSAIIQIEEVFPTSE